nr:PREDICTED: pleckstrin homology domain-containing family S member 1 [Anolis carolinensis]|eukprot:XP_008112941.1 PREDICTED: pleckstrin homology domain-containing family S member 1 [Anolis carolinensis]
MDNPRKSSIENYYCEEVCKPIPFKRSPPVQRKLELRTRSKSSPACLDEKHDEQCHGNECEELLTTISKERPTSEPIRQVPSEDDHVYESPRKIMRRLRRLTHSPLDEQSGEDYEKENYYASPRSIQAQLNETNPEFSSSDEEQSNDDGGYMSMKDMSQLIAEDFLSTSAESILPTTPSVKENSVNPQVIQDSPLKPTPLPRKAKPGKMPKISFLSVVQLSIILSKIAKDNQMQEVVLLFPQSDFIKCLTLTEASGHICVSQWSDPHHLGCIFHQGDCIVAVNDMHVKNMDDISLFTSRSTRKEVKLTIHRLPNSEILHAKGCKCL